MAIPDYQSLMNPVLEELSSSGVQSMRELTERITAVLQLTEEEQRETITSGMSLIANRGRSSELVRVVHSSGTRFRQGGTPARFRVF